LNLVHKIMIKQEIELHFHTMVGIQM
jgi:hypothetical protein